MNNEKKTVLVVEDDSDIRQFLADTLVSEGYEVVLATHGQEAQAVLRRIAPPAIILLDLVMPVMNGWELMRALQADPALSQIPVVILSATPEAIPVGARGVIAKPGNLETLLDTVARFTERRAEMRVPVRLDVAVRRFDSGPAFGVTVNLSEGGILFQSAEEVALGAPLQLTVTLEPERMVSIGTQVRHVALAPDGRGYHVGARFVALDAESGQAIRDVLAQLAKPCF